MQLKKWAFFSVLLGIFVLPFFLYNLAWLINSAPAAGTMCFMGKTINGQLSSSYPVIRFSTHGTDTVFFNGLAEAVFKPGDPIPVRYNTANPADARINLFAGIWQDTIIYAMVPFMLLLIVFLRPDIIPRGSVFVIGGSPFLRIDNSGKKPC